MIKEATGCTVSYEELLKDNYFDIRDFGAAETASVVANTDAINSAIEKASYSGGTVVIPKGEFKTYTIRLKSNVNIYFEEGAVIRAGRCDITKGYELQEGEGGNYDEPEVQPYVGIQDHGHTYFANSFVYGADIENVMIYGKGLFDGSYVDDNDYVRYALLGGDPQEPEKRDQNGHRGSWFGNKGIALLRCKNVVFKDFSIVDCGHFAIITEGVKNMLVDGILIDTIRDAFDVDCCQDVTVINSTFNSLTDDALVLKASFGVGTYMPIKNVYIENCKVMGYDAGSVYAGKYTCDKLVAEDNEGPTGRVKLGTEASCGYEQVTVRNTTFNRSRGFALEAVDAAPLSDIIFEDCVMDDISSSPIFIKAGDRGRLPVTGKNKEGFVYPKEDVRLDNAGWIIPDKEGYEKWPAKRYAPSYKKDKLVTVDGKSFFNIVNDKAPVKLNPANYVKEGDKYYLYSYDEQKGYFVDHEKEVTEDKLGIYGNAVSCSEFAKIKNIRIKNVKITNADPRYPMVIMGLEDCHIENVEMSDISVEYRGGMDMKMAVEQRQLNTNWEYAQFGAKPSIQRLPWLVNTFFLKNEGLLPRADWDEKAKCFVDSPYNIPELPGVYPEPANWGILPAYGLYARHVDGLQLSNVEGTYIVEDERRAYVFDDVRGSILSVKAAVSSKAHKYVTVSNNFKRPTNMEYVKNMPYHKTTCDISFDEANPDVLEVLVNAPAPGTPMDELYPYPASATAENGYKYDVDTDELDLPRTVYRPYFMPIDDYRVKPGQLVCFDVIVRNPATDSTDKKDTAGKYGEMTERVDYTVSAVSGSLYLQGLDIPKGADFDELTGNFIWTPEEEGEYDVVFVADDGVIPVHTTVHISVSEEV